MLSFSCCFIQLRSKAQYAIIDTAAIYAQMKTAKYDSTLSRLYGIIGWELRFSNRPKAMQLADQMEAISLPAKDYIRLAEAYRIRGFVKVVDQDLKGCLEMYGIGMEYAKKAKSIYYQISFLNLIGGMYHDKGDFDVSIQYYLEALKMAEANNESEMIASVSNNIAEAYSDAGRSIGFTRPFYEKALAQVIPRENWQYAGMIHSNMAKEYMMVNKLDSARMEIQLSESYLAKVGIKGYVYATCATDIGEILTTLKQYKLAERYLVEATYIIDSLKLTDNRLITLSALTNLYAASGQYDKAKEKALLLLQMSTTYRAKPFLRSAYKILAEISEASGQPDVALVFYKQYQRWNDSIYNESKEKAITNAENRIKLSKQASENDQLKQMNARLRDNNLLTLSVAILLLVIAIIVVAAYRKTRQQNKRLEVQKQTIETQSKEKDLLIREVHHRVKNNLQVVSSLLNLQAATLTDKQAIEALNTSQKRIKAISLIHQNLYGFDQLSTISFSAYISELYEDLRQLYNMGSISLYCTTDPEDLNFDIERSVPLGLIINEVITNALKYAFNEKEYGQIAISCKQMEDGFIEMKIADDGAGLVEAFENERTNSLGFRIIQELTKQLKGTVTCTAKQNEGTAFSFRFPTSSLKNPIV